MFASLSPARLAAAAPFILAWFAQPLAAHSWVEEMHVISDNGTLEAEAGYIRGFVPRSSPAFSDHIDLWLLPPNGEGNEYAATDALCRPSQTTSNYSDDFPMLNVYPGAWIALQYLENGHVTKIGAPPNKPLNRGTVYIYGTAEPNPDETFLNVFQQWTADGTGGDGRGRLLATRNFDDGQCYEDNPSSISAERKQEFPKTSELPMGSSLWCQNDIQLPGDLEVGSTYTLYWIWNWPTMNDDQSPTDIPSNGRYVTVNETYTNCMDVKVKAPTSGKASANTNTFSSTFVHDQDLNKAAVLNELTGGAFEVPVPGSPGSGGTASGGNGTTGNGSTDSSSASSAPTKTSTVSTGTTAAATGSAGEHTVYITLTTTEATATVTVTDTAAGAGATTAKSGRRTTTRTEFDTILVTKTRAPSAATSTAVANGAAAGSDTAAAAAPTSSAFFVATPGSAPTVQPFLTGTAAVPAATTLKRMRRS